MSPVTLVTWGCCQLAVQPQCTPSLDSAAYCIHPACMPPHAWFAWCDSRVLPDWTPGSNSTRQADQDMAPPLCCWFPYPGRQSSSCYDSPLDTHRGFHAAWCSSQRVWQQVRNCHMALWPALITRCLVLCCCCLLLMLLLCACKNVLRHPPQARGVDRGIVEKGGRAGNCST
jgi:hypothetical protein